MAEVIVDPLKDKRVELVLGQLDELPTLPAVALRVLEVTSGDEGSAREVVGLISADPALTTRILKLVNRADSGVRGEVNSIERAVVLLGFEAVRSAVLAVSVFQTFQASSSGTPRSTNEAARMGAGQAGGGGGATGFSREAFWRHSIAVATCAEMLATQLRGAWGKESRVDPGEAFICGLLHDLGKLAMDAALPKSFAKVVEACELLRGNIADVERQIVGLDHMVVGKRLAEKWKLPPSVRDCVWLHGQAPGALPATVTRARLVNLITLADVVARELHLGYSGNYAYPVPRKQLLDAVGVTEAQVAAVTGGLVPAIEEKSEILGLGQASSDELYQQALAQANRELGRVSTQLAVKNKRLAVRARFFDALAEFHGQISPDAAPTVVLRAIGETAREALGGDTSVTGVAAFSVPPGRNYAEVVVGDGSSSEPETVLVDCAERPVWSASVGTAVEVGPGLEFVIESVSPKLGGGRRYWTALLSEGEVVGGVIWGGPEASSAGHEEEPERLGTMRTELAGLVGGWALALRTSQIRDEARLLSEQLAEANRNLQDAQGELTRARTLVTIAEMAAGAAHEMNNPLAVICGRSQLLASQITDEKQRKSAKQIAEQSERLSGMITELMDFAKPGLPAAIDSDVAEIVGRSIELTKARGELTDRQVEVSVSGVPRVRVDPGQVASALAEILDNASQATTAGTGGTTTAGSGGGASRGSVTVSAAHDPFGGHVVLTVTDDGCGMDEHTLRRAFDPFFSFKPAGRRRGMGLAKAQRWIEAAGGSIRLESRQGSGTRAIVLLPAAREDSQGMGVGGAARDGLRATGGAGVGTPGVPRGPDGRLKAV